MGAFFWFFVFVKISFFLKYSSLTIISLKPPKHSDVQLPRLPRFFEFLFVVVVLVDLVGPSLSLSKPLKLLWFGRDPPPLQPNVEGCKKMLHLPDHNFSINWKKPKGEGGGEE